MATIKAVAKRAVWDAIKQLNYSPSAVARSLKVNHTKSIGLLASTSEAPYFAEIIEAIEHQCFAKGYTLILCNSHNDASKQQAYLQMLAQKRVDGLLVMCAEYPAALLSLLEEYRHIPMVVIDWGEVRGDFTDTIIDNAFAGGYMATHYLLQRGHRDIGAIPGQLARNTGGGRHRGYLHALKEAGITPNEAWIVQGDFEPSSGLSRHAIYSCSAPPSQRDILRRRRDGDGRFVCDSRARVARTA